jgi:hypothetical protein
MGMAKKADKEGNVNIELTQEELDRLSDSRSVGDWTAACDAIKDARGGEFPEGWHPTVTEVDERWVETKGIWMPIWETVREYFIISEEK